MSTAYYGTFIDTPTLGTLRVRHDTAVIVDNSGTIVEIGPESILGKFEGKVIKTSSSQWFTPGFIDTHIHASQYPNIGIGLGLPLLEWLDKYTFNLEGRYKENLDLATSVYSKVISRTLGTGTTTGCYFTTLDAVTSFKFAQLAVEYGQKALVGKVCMNCNQGHPEYEELLEDCQKLSQWLNQELARLDPERKLVEAIVTPRFAPVCTKEMMLWLGSEAKLNSSPIQTHMSENLGEIELVKETFPDCKTYAEVYAKNGLLTSKTILAHCVHLTPEDIELLQRYQLLVSHCPTSNTFLLSGRAPIRRYLYDYNINVGLGTDVLGGFDLLMLAMVKHAVLTSHEVAIDLGDKKDQLLVAEALYLATIGGARLLEKDASVGLFEVGKLFDTQLIDLEASGSPIDVFSWQNINELVNKWVFAGDDRNCIGVWVNGHRVIHK